MVACCDQNALNVAAVIRNDIGLRVNRGKNDVVNINLMIDYTLIQLRVFGKAVVYLGAQFNAGCIPKILFNRFNASRQVDGAGKHLP